MKAPKYGDLKKMEVEDLIKEHDLICPNVYTGVSYFLDELARRDQEKANSIMLDYTRQIKKMTLIVTLATIINLIVTIFAAF